MSTFALTDVALFTGAFNVRADHSALTVVESADLQDVTAFGHTAHVFQKGLTTATFEYAGWSSHGTDEIEEILSAVLGTKRYVSFAASSDNGDTAWTTTEMVEAHTPVGGTVGDAAAFSATARAAAPLARGLLLENAASARTSTFNATAYQLGAVAADETLYGTIHVVTVSGTTPTLDVVVQSDNADTMSSPTSRLTFTQATAATSEQTSVAGAITDDWYRLSVTIGGSDPSFLFAVVVGIA